MYYSTVQRISLSFLPTFCNHISRQNKGEGDKFLLSNLWEASIIPWFKVSILLTSFPEQNIMIQITCRSMWRNIHINIKPFIKVSSIRLRCLKRSIRSHHLGFHTPPSSKCLSGLLHLTTSKDLFTQFQNTNRIPVSVKCTLKFQPSYFLH